VQPQGRFTQKSTDPSSTPADDPVASLKKLKDMFDLGLIDKAEFDAKKAEIIGRM
jgi:hypothetical protein